MTTEKMMPRINETAHRIRTILPENDDLEEEEIVSVDMESVLSIYALRGRAEVGPSPAIA